MAAAARALLTGRPLPETAAAFGIATQELTDAADVYHAAGLAALQDHATRTWHQVRVLFTDWHHAEHIAATRLGPMLDRLVEAGAASGWWFLRKHPHWRLRFADPDPAMIERALDDLVAAGIVAGWRAGVYEAETFAFGGPAAMRIVHELFCADSHGTLDYVRHPNPTLGRRELSLVLLGTLLHHAGLDWFETGDVFAKVAQIRPITDIEPDRLAPLTSKTRALIATAHETGAQLFGSDGTVPFAAPWHVAHTAAGQQLRRAADTGNLARGLRTVLSHIVIFHWNRLGLTASTQGVLARAAVEAFLPRS
ncbi:thiopeptide-type bacteriocin biosynthesis protein [Dactylosporangium cerinum]